jgi:2-polyprenyl-6-hydroxyphenyl methylase / 3-demethylubiquinone-9 3-methyltransferase
MKKNDLEYYDLNADKWWKKGETLHLSEHLNKSRFELFKNYMPSWQGIKVLDIGCGGGLASESFAKQGANVSGIDLSLNSIKVAQDHAKENHLQIDYQCAVAEHIPYKENTFDVVVCFDVLEHIQDLHKVISEVYRVLKKKGYFFFDTINRTFKSRLIMIWLLEYIVRQIPCGLHDWNKFIKPDELTEIMEKKGFTDIVIKGFDLTDSTNFQTMRDIFFKGLNNQSQDEKAELFKIRINDDTSVCYLGKAVKP